MKKEQTQSEFVKMLNISEIYQSIEGLEKRLNEYKRDTAAREERYMIQLEINKVIKKATELQADLESLIDQSLIWETK